MQTSINNMVDRHTAARGKFVECVMRDGFTKADANTVADAYCHLGLLKFDAVDGQFYIKNGCLFDAQTMRNAVKNAAQIFATRARKFGRR